MSGVTTVTEPNVTLAEAVDDSTPERVEAVAATDAPFSMMGQQLLEAGLV